MVEARGYGVDEPRQVLTEGTEGMANGTCSPSGVREGAGCRVDEGCSWEASREDLRFECAESIAKSERSRSVDGEAGEGVCGAGRGGPSGGRPAGGEVGRGEGRRAGAEPVGGKDAEEGSRPEGKPRSVPPLRIAIM
eukprot:evm.model.scf_1786.2 EVM.evm.TU.scf_1786.2   scf_1786:28141-28548(+)